MSVQIPPLQQLNRTFIGSVLFIDIVGYSRRTVPDQLEMKELFNSIVAHAVQNVAPSDRIMVDTGDGAGIAFLGDPEDALFTALSIRDAIHTDKIKIGDPGFARMGINLGPLKLVRDINGHTNMIGDGVNDAQRVMSFADPGQVMVSRSYYDIISRFSRDYAQLFNYEGTRHDKHVREHEVYRFGPAVDNEGLTEKLRDRSRARQVVEPAAAHHSQLGAWMTRSAAATAAKNAAMPRTVLIAAAVGAATVAGAAWFWSSAFGQKPGANTPAATPAPQAADSAKRIDTVKPAVVKPSPEPAPISSASSSIPAQLALAAPIASAASSTLLEKNKPASAQSSAKSSAPAAKPGIVKLAIQPWAEIYVDGSKRGISPPLKSLELAPGKHKIEVRNGQFMPYKETVEVKSGGEATVRYVF
ncbi:MAG TPA: PEGA domain-containing protein [Noviherbaspirillum sp.]